MTPEQQAKRVEAAAKRRFEKDTSLVWARHQRLWLEAAALDLAAADEAVPVVATRDAVADALDEALAEQEREPRTDVWASFWDRLTEGGEIPRRPR